MTAFEEMGVLPEIARAVEEMGWTLPTDVQAEAIPLILGGGDVLMAAETGSGKTGAFCLPVVQTVWETLKGLKEGSFKSGPVPIASTVITKWTLSTHDRGSAFAITPDGLRCQSREQKEWHGSRATKGVYGKGKYYFEALVADEGLCRMGWSTQQAVLDLGTDRYSFGYGGTGKKSHNRSFDDYGESFGKNDVIGCCLDLDQFEMFFLKNGLNLGPAFGIPGVLRSEVFYPAIVLKNAEMQLNFGDGPFKHGPPSGFVSVSQAPLDNVKVSTLGHNTVDKKPRKLLANAPQAIIIEPSRELADQTFNQLRKFREYLNSPTVRDVLLVGGAAVKDQIAALQQGVDIVVATPGRLDDLISSGELVLSQCRFFILDEADGLLKAGNLGLINKMHQEMPKMSPDGRRLQMIVCSATLHDFEVKKLAEKSMHFPTWVDLKGEDAVPETVHHVVVPIDPRKDLLWQTLKVPTIPTDQVHHHDNIHSGNPTPETFSEGTKILKGEYCLRAIDSLKMDQAIIFCRTKLDCDNLEAFMNRRGKSYYTCVCLHADRNPQERKDNLERFKGKQVKFLICTDVAARGIDISGVPFMINVTLPDEKSNYVHRIGRVGRAERMGLAISLVSTVPEKVWYHGQWCRSRGKNCDNTNLTSQQGCCMWYNEMQYLSDIEDHLGVTIQQIGTDINVPADEFDGKVVYGQKRKELQSGVEYHLNQTSSSLAELTALESEAQTLYLNRYFTKVK